MRATEILMKTKILPLIFGKSVYFLFGKFPLAATVSPVACISFPVSFKWYSKIIRKSADFKR